MFDTSTREIASSLGPAVLSVLCLNVEVMRTADGLLCVSLAATSVDEERLELISDDIEIARVTSVDLALAVIRRGINDALYPNTRTEVQ